METIDEIVCPFCGHEDFRRTEYEEDDEDEVECEKCGSIMKVECYLISRYFRTEKFRKVEKVEQEVIADGQTSIYDFIK